MGRVAARRVRAVQQPNRTQHLDGLQSYIAKAGWMARKLRPTSGAVPRLRPVGALGAEGARANTARCRSCKRRNRRAAGSWWAAAQVPRHPTRYGDVRGPTSRSAGISQGDPLRDNGQPADQAAFGAPAAVPPYGTAAGTAGGSATGPLGGCRGRSSVRRWRSSLYCRPGCGPGRRRRRCRH